MTIEYFADEPACRDRMWCAEMDAVAEFCVGRGLDPGAGGRTFDRATVRCDIRREMQPDYICDATALPFSAATFDYVVTSHLLEHLEDPRAVLREWLRVVRVGGYVCAIVPDTTFTHGMNTDPTPHLHEWAAREFAQEVLGWDNSQLPWCAARGPLDWTAADLVLFEEACAHWSFACVLRKE